MSDANVFPEFDPVVIRSIVTPDTMSLFNNFLNAAQTAYQKLSGNMPNNPHEVAVVPTKLVEQKQFNVTRCDGNFTIYENTKSERKYNLTVRVEHFKDLFRWADKFYLLLCSGESFCNTIHMIFLVYDWFSFVNQTCLVADNEVRFEYHGSSIVNF